MDITTNNQPRELYSFFGLLDQDKKEMLAIFGDSAEEMSYFYFKGSCYSLADFMRTEIDGWDGIYSSSAFSAVLVRIVDSDSVVVGQAYS